MPKIEVPKFERRATLLRRRVEKRELKQIAHKAKMAENAHFRRIARQRTFLTYLKRKLARAGGRPSALTVRQLRDMASDSALPAAVRLEAAGLLLTWATEWPETGDDGRIRKPHKGRARR